MNDRLIRIQKIQKWFDERKGTIELENIQSVLNNHDMGVCSHLEINGAPSGTIWSWIAPLGTHEVYIADGAPCKNQYTRFGF